MNKIRFSFFVAGAVLTLAVGSLRAQTSIQQITFSLLGQYQTNILGTNTANAAGPLTNQDAFIHDVLITTHSVIKALALDVDGLNWTNWILGNLVREVNLTNGHEGIFLRYGAMQTNVSSYFGGSFSNNFTAGLTSAFPGLTNNISGLTNNIYGSTNDLPQFQVDRGWLIMADPTNTTTNFFRTGGLYFISFNTTNLKFNVVGVGDGTITNVGGDVNGTSYTRDINAEYVGTAGTYYMNITTNFFDTGTTTPPVFFSGPLHGTITTTQPIFSPIPGP
jgi:hypothetical protein